MPKPSSTSSSSYSHHLELPSLWFLSQVRAAKMRSKASGYLKQVLTLLASAIKSKSAMLKRKTGAVKTRLIIFRLLHNRKLLMSAISDKIRHLIAVGREADGEATSGDDGNKTILRYISAEANEVPPEWKEMIEAGAAGGEIIECEEEEEYSCYSDLASTDSTGSAIGLVLNSEVVVEDDIDHAAELFIKRFHERIRMQEMLDEK
ncbi:hypothetical protein Taro_029327 [Colocasia esculenta]|uniref:Uncharacterized protein n=1 Tax=Colocasia esculenta TaxID=4460 RepID=A0A843VZY8_COLES|nr:hypothetical protein [Colocasia esculenta]